MRNKVKILSILSCFFLFFAGITVVSAEENFSYEDLIGELDEISEIYNVDVELNENDIGILSTRDYSADEIEKVKEEVKEMSQLANFISNGDNWEVEKTNITPSDLAGTATQQQSIDLSTFGGEWAGESIPMTKNISFSYSAEESDVPGGLPSFTSITNVSSYSTGVDAITWDEEVANGGITGADTIALLSASGAWRVTGEIDIPGVSVDIGVSQQDDWEMEYSSSNL